VQPVRRTGAQLEIPGGPLYQKAIRGLCGAKHVTVVSGRILRRSKTRWTPKSTAAGLCHGPTVEAYSAHPDTLSGGSGL